MDDVAAALGISTKPSINILRANKKTCMNVIFSLSSMARPVLRKHELSRAKSRAILRTAIWSSLEAKSLIDRKSNVCRLIQKKTAGSNFNRAASDPGGGKVPD
jgi:hypothetical protein